MQAQAIAVLQGQMSLYRLTTVLVRADRIMQAAAIVAALQHAAMCLLKMDPAQAAQIMRAPIIAA